MRWELRDIAGRRNAGNAGLEERVDQDAAVEAKSGTLGERRPGSDADAHDYHIRGDFAPLIESDARLFYRDRGLPHMEGHALDLCSSCMNWPSCGPRIGSIGRSSGATKLDLETARAERRSDVKSDETRAKDHCTAPGLGACDNGAAIVQRAQRMDMSLIAPGISSCTGSVPVASRSWSKEKLRPADMLKLSSSGPYPGHFRSGLAEVEFTRTVDRCQNSVIGHSGNPAWRRQST
jgi:hypothetical protein